MRQRLVLALSVGLNIVLAVMIWRLTQDLSTATAPVFSTNSAVAQAKAKVAKTNVVVRRIPIRWADLESSDFPTYIQNLRSIGCPEQTIRDIIVAEVEQLFDKRKRTEIVSSEQQWWRSEPDPQVMQSALDKYAALEKEKEEMLTQLLGANWRQPQHPLIPEVNRLDGPILGSLSPEARESLRRVETAAAERVAAYSAAMNEAGRPVDPAELARLRQQTRAELATVLNPEQLEEYLLRYSKTAETLRKSLAGLNAGPDEFRKIFRATDAYESQLEFLTQNDPTTAKRRAELEKARDQALQQLIGPERFNFYKLSQNPLFQEAQARAQEVGAPPEKVLPIYEMNKAAQAELDRIRKDSSLTEADKVSAVEKTQTQLKSSIEKLLSQ